MINLVCNVNRCVGNAQYSFRNVHFDSDNLNSDHTYIKFLVTGTAYRLFRIASRLCAGGGA